MFKKIKDTFKVISLVLLMGIVIVGCGKEHDEELEAYKASMTSFYDKLAYYNSSINAIDPDSESSKQELLGYLDEMNDTYKEMAAVEIPEQFQAISDIAVESADYMQKANEFYHMAYDNEFDEDSEMLASQYYERANNRVLIMLQVLHGEVPEGEGITVETQSTYEMSTIPTDGEVEGESEAEAGTESE